MKMLLLFTVSGLALFAHADDGPNTDSKPYSIIETKCEAAHQTIFSKKTSHWVDASGYKQKIEVTVNIPSLGGFGVLRGTTSFSASTNQPQERGLTNEIQGEFFKDASFVPDSNSAKFPGALLDAKIKTNGSDRIALVQLKAVFPDIEEMAQSAGMTIYGIDPHGELLSLGTAMLACKTTTTMPQ